MEEERLDDATTVGRLVTCRKRKHATFQAYSSYCWRCPSRPAHQQEEAMLCDSGATICVIAEHLIPKETDILWVGTVDVEPRS